MALLKRVQASTLMETMTATVLIVVIFMVASLVLNNLFQNTTRTRVQDAHHILHKMEYAYSRGKLNLPVNDIQNDWRLTAQRIEESGKEYVIFEAIHQKTGKKITKNTAVRYE
ncbi:hypothetical protein ACJD0Z_04320 [Flavobacteriaceae bacterium M23B6Z8]